MSSAENFTQQAEYQMWSGFQLHASFKAADKNHFFFQQKYKDTSL